MERDFTLSKSRCGIVLMFVWGLLSQAAYGQIEMSTLNTTYIQDFNSLPAVGGEYEFGVSAFLPDGWSVQRSRPSNVIVANTGSFNKGDLYSYGLTNSTDRALGAIASTNSGEFTYNLLLRNTSGRTITALDIAYIGEQWRCGSVNTDVQSIHFTYAIAQYPNAFNLSTRANTPGWTQVPAMRFQSPVIRRTAGHVNGNLPENRAQLAYTLPEVIPDGYYVMLRWYDPDELDQDHGLAIDDVKVTWHFMQDYTPLPVELTKFSAKQKGKQVELAWTTASEQDSKHYEIERSINGKDFHTLGLIQAQGTTSLTTHYTYIDSEPLPGKSYYRLKQVDEDQTYTYSKVTAVHTSATNQVVLYPTIASQEVKVEVPHAPAIYQAAVYDKSGSIVFRQTLAGKSTYTLNTSQLRHGSYMMVLHDETGTKQVLRFLKK